MDEQDRQNITISVPLSFADLHAFSRLIRELRFENRFFLSEGPSRFLAGLIKYTKQYKTHSFSSGQHFYRARVHEFRMEVASYPLDRMGSPPSHKATHGRLNPVGIPYLYLANDIDTAVSEVRPWIGCQITVAEFALQHDVSVINFSNKVFTSVPSGDAAAAEFTWRELITSMFSMPFDPRDDTAYMATQYIAERIKKEGFDGILYDSALNKDGYNLTLFHHEAAKPHRGFKVEVKSISYQNRVSELPAATETRES
jgi:RES domain-containing protein